MDENMVGVELNWRTTVTSHTDCHQSQAEQAVITTVIK